MRAPGLPARRSRGAPDCIIIGGGIAGLCTARALARAGARVTLLCGPARRPAASQVAGGILSSLRPWTEPPASVALSRAGAACYPGLTAALREETGIDPEYQRCGLLMLGREDAAASRRWCAVHGIPCQDGDGVLRLSGLHCPDHALFLPHIAQVRTPRLLQALAASLPALGVTVQAGQQAAALQISGEHCRGVKTGAGEQLSAACVVIAAGAWSCTLLPGGQAAEALEAVRGQMLCLRFARRPFTPVLLDGGRYLIPRNDGHLLLGSTMERVGLNCAATAQGKAGLLDWARRLWPGVSRGQLIWHRAGLRPARRNRAPPWYGAAPGLRNVYLHSGHFRKGILQAPITAERLARIILEHREQESA